MKKYVFFYKTVLIEPEGKVTEELCWADLSWSHYFTYQKRVNGTLTESKRFEMDTECYTGALIRRRGQMAQLRESQSETLMIIINGQAIPDPHQKTGDPLKTRPYLIPSKYRMEYYPGMIRDLSVIEKDRIVAQQEKELQQKQIELNALRQKTEDEFNAMMRDRRKAENDLVLRRGECDDVPEELRQ